jgi:peptidoglycan/LPS O-acetylase OafA/YrhL
LGSIRTLLAVSVLFYHAYGVVFVSGALAVQLFFLISGFLISFVLLEAKTYGTVRSFYKNRALRLFPLYFVVALGTLALYFGVYFVLGIETPFFAVFREIDWIGRVALTLSNLLVFGQDWIMFTAVRDGNFQITGFFWPTEVPVWDGLLIIPGWSLGVELTFYLVAPFILPRRKLLVTLLCASLALRLVFIMAGFGLKDPWSYRFFPTELALFLIGALSHQVLMPRLKKRGWMTRKTSIAITAFVFTYCVIFSLLPFPRFQSLTLFVIFALSLPFLFQFQNSFRFDRKIGELSYPIYIVHMTVLLPVSYLFDRIKDIPGYTGLDMVLAVLVLTVIASIVLHRLGDKHIERLRDRVRGNSKANANLRIPTLPKQLRA